MRLSFCDLHKVLRSSVCVTQYKNAAAGMVLADVLHVALMSLARFCNPAFATRMIKAAAELLAAHVLHAMLLQGWQLSVYETHCTGGRRIAFGDDWILTSLAGCILLLNFFLESLQNCAFLLWRGNWV